jgi:hypothetical protein
LSRLRSKELRRAKQILVVVDFLGENYTKRKVNRRPTQTFADSIFSSRRPVGRKTCMPSGQTGFLQKGNYPAEPLTHISEN